MSTASRVTAVRQQLRAPTEQEYHNCILRAITRRHKKVTEGRLLQFAGGALTLIGIGLTSVTTPVLAGAALELLVHPPRALAFFGAPAVGASGIGIFVYGSYQVAQGWDEFHRDLVKCAGAVEF